MGKKKILCFSTMIIIFIIFIKTLFHVRLNPSDEWFTNIDHCPACFGNSLCPQFFHGDISLIGISKFKYINFVNSKNVFSGKLSRDRVILKKLAHDWEIAEKDELICMKAKLQKSCDIRKAVELLIKNSLPIKSENSLLDMLNSFGSETDTARCPSERLLAHMLGKIYTQPTNFSSVQQKLLFKLGEMMYSLLINPEAIILQAFSQAEGWPFPRYYGACGRVIVEEYVGRTIASFEDASWEQRIDIAYQLLLIAQTLTENFSQFAFYMTDVNMDNFAVRPDGTVLLIDVESIVIVDRLVRKKGKNLTNEFHQSKGEFCKDCLNFSFEDLCSHDLSDHNYYAVCKGLLVPNSYYSTKGYLHSIPENINAISNLSSLIQECAEPYNEFGRFHVVPKILQVMKSLL